MRPLTPLFDLLGFNTLNETFFPPSSLFYLDCIKFVSSSSSSSFVAETDPREERFWWNENAKGPWGRGRETREHKKAFGSPKRRGEEEREKDRERLFYFKTEFGMI